MRSQNNQKTIRLTFGEILNRQLLKCLTCPNAITPKTSGFLLLNYNPRFLAGFCKKCWRTTPEKQLERTIKAYFQAAVENAPARSFGGAEPVLRSKELYLAKYPQTAAGKSQASGMNKVKGNNVAAESAATLTPSFVADTAAKTAIAERTIREDVQVATRIAEPVRNVIRETPIADNKSELLMLSRLDNETQSQVAAHLETGTATTVTSALREISNQPLAEVKF